MKSLTVSRKACLLSLAAILSLPGCSLLPDQSEKEVVAPLVDLPADALSLDKQWSRSVGSQGDEALSLMLNPVIDGGTIYAASAEGDVLAISRGDGDVRWRTDLDVPVTSAVGAGAGLVVVSTLDGGIHALDAANGEPRWRAQASSEVLAAAASDGDVVVVQSVDSRVQAFEASTGKSRWTYSASQAILSLRGNAGPVIRDGMVYVAFDTGKVAALDARTGLMRWEQRFVIPDGRSELERVIDVQGDPLVVDGTVYVGSYQGAVIAVDLERGQPRWEQKASVMRILASGDGSVFLVEGNDAVRALRMVDGREAWKSESFGGRRLSGPAVIGDYLAVADKEGYIHLLSQSDGRYAGRYHVGGDGVRGNLASDGSTLYVLTNSGTLHALAVSQ